MARKPSYKELEKRVQLLEEELAHQSQSKEQTGDNSLDRLLLINTLFKMIPNPVFYKNRQGIYLGCNKAFAELILGIPEEQIIGCSLYDLPELIPKKLADIYAQQDKTLFANPGLQVYETKVKCSDGTLRDFLFYKTTYRDHRGEVAGILGLMLDITEKNRIQLELAESEEKYRSMMESMREPVYICSPDLTITYMNSKMISHIGRDATGELCHQVLHNLEEPCTWCCFNAIRQGEKVEMEIRSPRDNHHYLVTSSPIYHQNGAISKMTIYRDITERRKMEQELLMAKKIEASGVFAGGIAHDFNNLLFIILGNLLMLKREPDCPERIDLIDAAEDAAQRGAELTRKLLAFTHDEPLNLEQKDIGSLLEKIGSECHDHKNCNITTEVGRDLPPIPIDQPLMSIVFENIVKNSVEAMEDGGEIQIRAKLIEIDETSLEIQQGLLAKVGKYLQITISDTGPGIAEELLPRIFDPYFSTRENPTTKGLGLGLSISYSIVRKHNGAMTAQSSPGNGTNITILLPTREVSARIPPMTMTPHSPSS